MSGAALKSPGLAVSLPVFPGALMLSNPELAGPANMTDLLRGFGRRLTLLESLPPLSVDPRSLRIFFMAASKTDVVSSLQRCERSLRVDVSVDLDFPVSKIDESSLPKDGSRTDALCTGGTNISGATAVELDDDCS